MNKKLLTPIVLLIGGCCLAGVVINVMGGAVPQATVAPLAQSAATETPTDAPEPTRTPAATKTPLPTKAPEVVAGLIPGLVRTDVTVNLEERGFTCGSVEESDGYYSWLCQIDNDEASGFVTVYGRTLTTVDLIDASITAGDDVAGAILGFIATMPFEGAEPEAARGWVEATLPGIAKNGDVRTKRFGGVEYRLFGAAPGRVLEIGELQ